MAVRKNFVLDTTVLLYDPKAMVVFGENNVIIPIAAVEDIDRFKKDLSETGRNARQVSRDLDALRAKGTLVNGADLDGGGRLFVRTRIEQGLSRVSAAFGGRNRDALVLAAALDVMHESDLPTVLVTKDINLRIKADALGLAVEDFESDRVDIDELYVGHTECMVDADRVDALLSGQEMDFDGALLPNQYVAWVDQRDKDHCALGRYESLKKKIVPLVEPDRSCPQRIEVRNREQAFAMDALLNDDIGLVSLVGKAGTGKTLLAVAAAIHKTVDQSMFTRILVSRPTLPMGQDIGYLPGTVEQKLTPWMYPIADNVELIMRADVRARRTVRGFKELVEMGILVIEPLTYIRGRSIHNQYLIVDEAQNLTPHEIKTIITRVGDGTKIVLTGDPYQIDNPYIDSSSNGLTCCVERFKDQSVAAHVYLHRGERSVLSELAANIL